MNSRPSAWEAATLEQNRRWLLSYVYAVTGDMNVSEDIVQESLTIAWEKQDTLRAGTAIGPWLRGIARNVVKQKRALNRRIHFSDKAVEILEEQAAKLETFHLSDAEDTLICRVKECMKRLSREARRIFLMKYLRTMNSRDIAKKLAINIQKVDTTVFRARKAVLKCVKEKAVVE